VTVPAAATEPGGRRPLVLFYNRLFPRMGEPEDFTATDCGGTCAFSVDRSCLPRAAAVVFHIPTLRGVVLPRRYPGQQWVAWSMESEANYPALADPAFMRQFEITMTYRRDATVWCPYFGGPGFDAAAFLTPPRPKTETAPVAYFQSSPIDRWGRTAYAWALMRRVKVDSYGKVLHNRDLAEPDSGRGSMLAATARHKFTLVLENSLTEDYVSDKFFDALIMGSVPVYRGAPNVAEFAPGANCFINAADFAGPVELAAYLNRLDQHDDEYGSYLAWKVSGLTAGFRALLESLRTPLLCRLCEYLRRARSPAG
jgi:Glycosyltransferase family 10 (fucosyltransferase) C-term/Fucosyltransferase, N-terminal